MRKIIVFGIVLAGLSTIAAAQVPTSGNVFFGYSYYNTNFSSLGSASTNGWEGSLEGKVFPFLGIVADFDGHYGSQSFAAVCTGGGGCGTVSANISANNVLFGPRASVSLGKFRPFAEVLVGLGHGSISGGPSDNSFATAVGGGLDYKIIKPIAWRFQGDYVHTSLFGLTQNNTRISTGIVLRF